VIVRRDCDWFGIAGELKVMHGRIELAVLLDGARRSGSQRARIEPDPDVMRDVGQGER